MDKRYMPRVYNSAVVMTINEVDNRFDVYYQSKKEAEDAIRNFLTLDKSNQFVGGEVIYLRDRTGHYRTVSRINSLYQL